MLQSPVDLHMHSTASDGRLAPADVVARAAAAGVELMALTDHDTLDGVEAARAAARELGVDCRAGIELSARWARGVVHIVGLDVDPEQATLREGVARQQHERYQRAERIGRRLARAGMPEIAARVASAAADGVPGRGHFARALVEAGHARDIPEAFGRYLQRGRAGYAPVDWADLDAVVGWIHAAGGVAVFAHPLRYRLSRGALRAALQAFVAAGGDAIEVASGGGGRDDLVAASALARRFGLEASIGSDFHDPDFPWIAIGRLPAVPSDLAPVWRRWRELT